ncbi:RdRP-domain-containing protein [Punctularia strigosozonata HHB-11173 SS5]|uniref:RdRP-domain-containing protein n=1 Tax=Punctularia strigosozonata (strain HHB-11173) TaxID=741275 RepID=UPI00044164E9|nr:RdRP-domain-containing protein [Punctularia strigosozonata HHB-11173 SS5]EIN05637.1 RdRP-domain-containing protein [Punctularia strigosozonata HHB-11173 SS5]
MDIFMRGIAYAASSEQIKQTVADILHSEPYARYSDGGIRLNFEAARQFLQVHGGSTPISPVSISGRRVTFQESNRPPRQDIVEYCRRMPYQDPLKKAEHDRLMAQLAEVAEIRSLQFGWECRDRVFSLEWEKAYVSCRLSFEGESRQIRIAGCDESENDSEPLGAGPQSLQQLLADVLGRMDLNHTLIDRRRKQYYMIRYAQIQGISTSDSDNAAFMSLYVPPSFETDTEDMAKLVAHRQWLLSQNGPKPQGFRRRVPHFGGDHQRVAPFASLAVRILFRSFGDQEKFRRMANAAGLRVSNYSIPIERRNIFSAEALDALYAWLKTVPWMVAFHLEVLHRKLLLEPREILELRPEVSRLLRYKGTRYTSQVIRHFAGVFKRLAKKFNPENLSWITETTNGIFDCLHVAVTPSSIIPREQYPDRSNRVIRRYPNHQQHFVRVQFCDEDYLQYRFDRDLDGDGFVRDRVGGVMRTGIRIGGRAFEFLAYSQSALKDHAVWFVRPFNLDGHRVDAEAIRQSLGTFTKVIRFPSLYGARMSQAFTATDPSITVTPNEIKRIPDIEIVDSTGQKRQFTDGSLPSTLSYADPIDYFRLAGVGTISLALAKDIASALLAVRKRKRGKYFKPRAFQIRFAGSKGMVSVDINEEGRVLCLRPSMIKFESPDSLDIEIAKTFDRPGKFLLNRPLIMILEGLGAPAAAFEALQDAAVEEAEAARESLQKSARMLEVHGLGGAYRLPSVADVPHRLGLPRSSEARGTTQCIDDEFMDRMVAFAVNHVLRELKHHARIPVPDSWTLVGIADIHGVLEEGEVFACVQPPQGGQRVYLEGNVMVTRSPVAHPGDVQMARAIGRPPPGSAYDTEPIPNTVIFSVKGSRPLPSALGGGDLDGDVFNVSQFADIFPRHLHPPASYEAAVRKELDRDSTIEDVMDFVVDFINNDRLGVIAINWLIIADQSPEGVFCTECIKLSQLHSDAVDFQKSGRSVPLGDVPRLLMRARPDWNAPETINPEDGAYYESTKAIGKLFRRIDLPGPQEAKEQARAQRRQMKRRRHGLTEDDIEDDLALTAEHAMWDDPITIALQARLREFLDLDESDDPTMVESVGELFDKYCSELLYLCDTHTISQSRRGMPLTEEEVVVGTIVAKTSQPRKRREVMAKMREQSALVVNSVRSDLAGEDADPYEKWLKKAWLAWRVAAAETTKNTFGAKSFGLIAIGSIIDGIRSTEDSLWNDGRYS